MATYNTNSRADLFKSGKVDLEDLNVSSGATSGQVLTVQSDGVSFDFEAPFDGAYSSLTGTPTNLSSFTNDSGFITDYTVTANDVTAHQANLSITESQISDLQTYLTSVALNDISDVTASGADTGQVLTAQSDGTFAFETPVDNDTTYTNLSEFTNDSGFITDYTVTSSDVTAHQANLSITESQISDLQTYLTSVALNDISDVTASGADTGQVLTAQSDGTFAFETVSVSGGVPYVFQGSTYGYSSGGKTSSPTNINPIDKFSFASEGNATNIFNLSADRFAPAGQSSTTDGYASGGSESTYVLTIDKFSFISGGDATDIGDVTEVKNASAGHSSSEYAYTSGGANNSPGFTVRLSTIDKFPFALDWTGTATEVGDLTVARSAGAGQSSSTNGYTTGGTPTSSATNIEKFPFTSDFTTATDIGDISVARSGAAGQSSSVSGYTSGGSTPTTNVIDKFPFASDWTGTATDVGGLTVARYWISGQSSTDYGYSCGGAISPLNPPYNNVTTIEKFPFATDWTGTATDVGDLTSAKYGTSGHQY